MTTLPQFRSWDSEFFGLRIAQWNPSNGLSVTDWQRVQMWCVEQGVDCLYILADNDSPGSILAAELVEIDQRVTLETNLDNTRRIIETDQTRVVRPFRFDDVPTLVEIARISHTDSRFFCDGHFPRNRCMDLFQRWIERDCEKASRCNTHAVFVTTNNMQPVGYVTCSQDEDGITGWIGLIALAPAQRGRGLGGCLLDMALTWCRARGLNRCRVVTQGRNHSAMSLYRSRGFVEIGRQRWYHFWPKIHLAQAG